MNSTVEQLTLFNRSGRIEQWEKRLILNNLDKNNREIAQLLQRKESSIRNFLDKSQVRRNDEQLKQIRARIAANQTGKNNPNWKGGRSRDNYFYKLRTIERYPLKNAARIEVSKAIRKGDLIPEPCFICGEHKTQAHHEDYSKPLDVIWLDRKCHIIADRILRGDYKIKDYFIFVLNVLPYFGNGYFNRYNKKESKIVSSN